MRARQLSGDVPYAYAAVAHGATTLVFTAGACRSTLMETLWLQVTSWAKPNKPWRTSETRCGQQERNSATSLRRPCMWQRKTETISLRPGSCSAPLRRPRRAEHPPRGDGPRLADQLVEDQGGRRSELNASCRLLAPPLAEQPRALMTSAKMSAWDGRHSISGVTTSPVSNRSPTELASTRCGACASPGSLPSVGSATAPTPTSRGRPSSCDISTVKG